MSPTRRGPWQSLQGRKTPSDWEIQWQSHLLPLFLGTIEKHNVPAGIAKVLQAVGLRWQDEPFDPRFAGLGLV